MKKKIIVFPASKWQLGLIKYLKKNNYFVYSLDDSIYAEGHKVSDKILKIQTSNLREIKKFIKRENCKIISSCSDIGQKFINRINGKKNDHFNKIIQRNLQKKISLNTPLFFNNKNFNKLNFMKCKKKVICKPIYGSGSKNITYLDKYKKFKNKKIFYEQYIEGVEYNVDGFLYNKRVFFYGIMEKKKIKKSKTVSYIIKQNSLKRKIIKEIEEVLKKFIFASKYPNGPFHMEVIIQKKTNKIFLVEGHPREVGFNMYYLACKSITGQNLYKNYVYVKINKKLNDRDIISKNIYKNYCCRYIPIKKSGTIKNIHFKKFKDKKNIRTFINIFKKNNEVLDNNNDDASRMGYIMSFSNKKNYNLETYTKDILNKYFVINYY